MRKLASVPVAAMLFSLSLGATAGAVDLGLEPLYTKAPSAPDWSWTGFYMTGNAGGWANSTWLADVTKSGGGGPVGFQDAPRTAPGLLNGGQVGFNYQAGRWVFGIEGDVSDDLICPSVRH